MASLHSLPDTFVLAVAHLLDIGAILRLSLSCRRFHDVLFCSSALWLGRLSDLEQATKLPLAPNRTRGLRGLRDLVLSVHPLPRELPRRRHQDEDDDDDVRLFKLEMAPTMPWRPAGDGMSPPIGRRRRVVGIVAVGSFPNHRTYLPCILRDGSGGVLVRKRDPTGSTWAWLDLETGRTVAVALPELSGRIFSLSGTDLFVHSHYVPTAALTVSLSLLHWDAAAAGLVEIRPNPFVHLEMDAAFLHPSATVSAVASPDGAAWLWFGARRMDTFKVAAFRAVPVLDALGAIVSHDLSFIRTASVSAFVPDGLWSYCAFGSGVCVVTMSAQTSTGNAHHVRAIRITDGVTILDRIMTLVCQPQIVGTKLLVRTGADETGVDFTVVDLLAAAASCFSTGSADVALSDFRLEEYCAIEAPTALLPASSCVAGDFAVFAGNRPTEAIGLDVKKGRCTVFSAESPPEDGSLGLIAFYEEEHETDGAAHLRAVFSRHLFTGDIVGSK
ncbi:hypothetical protein DFJ73DRAFT_529771 [Zopfochytrium polystomum]|nr:hypothetical protein DFJ73DRAFT_529771 [Zopfochytrium polystomum]